MERQAVVLSNAHRAKREKYTYSAKNNGAPRILFVLRG